MLISADDLKMLISIGALVVSLVALYFTRVNWLQSNRPVVTAYVTEEASGNMATTYSLVVTNTGTRPAIRVRMHAPHEQIKLLLEDGASVKRFEMIEANFLSGSEIPLLHNGDELKTSFGAFISAGVEGPWLRYGAEANITLTYRDLEGRSYASKQPLKIYARNGFGGGVWGAKA